MIKTTNKDIKYIKTSDNISIIKVIHNNQIIWPTVKNTVFTNSSIVHSIADIDSATKNLNKTSGHCVGLSPYFNTFYYKIGSMMIDAPINRITITLSCHSYTGYITKIYCSFYDYDTKKRLYSFDISCNIEVHRDFRWITFSLPENVDLRDVKNPVIAVSYDGVEDEKIGRFGMLAGFGSNEEQIGGIYMPGIEHAETCPDISTDYPYGSLYNSAYIIAYSIGYTGDPETEFSMENKPSDNDIEYVFDVQTISSCVSTNEIKQANQ